MARQPLVAPRPGRLGGIAALAVGALLLTACAEPDRGTNTPLPPPSAAFDRLDTDADGAVGADEWDAAGNKVFASLDTDRSGSISRAESEAGFDALDLDRDGVIDTGEADIPSLDTDGDGVISRAEWHGEKLHETLDADGDDSVSRAEFMDYQREAFATHDVNGNSRIDRIDLDPSARRLTLFRF